MPQSSLKIENRVIIVNSNTKIALRDIPPEIQEVKIYDDCEFSISTPGPCSEMTTTYKSGIYNFDSQNMCGDYLIFKYDIE